MTKFTRLSQLEGIDESRYASDVLPPLLEQVVNCRDAIAQPYLLDCIINVFPDEFHLATLDSFLTCCTQLRDKVCVRSILEAMMRRLANGARQEDSEMVGPPGAFDAFDACASRLVEEKKEALLEDAEGVGGGGNSNIGGIDDDLQARLDNLRKT